MQSTLSSAGLSLLALNVACASILMGALAIVMAVVTRRCSLRLRHDLLLLPIILILISPLPIRIASQHGLGIVPVAGTVSGDRPLVPTSSPGVTIDKNEVERRREVVKHQLRLKGKSNNVPSHAGIDPEAEARQSRPATVSGLGAHECSLAQWLKWPVSLLKSNSELLVWIWAVVAMWQVARLAHELLKIRRLRSSLRTAVDPRLNRAAQAAFAAAGIPQAPVYESPLAPVPLTLGWWRSVIVMPEGLARVLDDEQLACVLAHEAAHVARDDTRVALLQKVVRAGFWWNPMLRAINREIDRLREQICDDSAVRLSGDGLPLAEAILNVAEWTAARTSRIPLAATLFDEDSIEQRIVRLSGDYQPVPGKLNRRSAAVIALFGILLTAGLVVPAVRADLAATAAEASEQQPTTERALPEGNQNGGEEARAIGQGKALDNSVAPAGDVEHPKEMAVSLDVRGRATNLEGQPIAGATIYIVRADQTEGQLGTTKTDTDGHYVFRDVRLPLHNPWQEGAQGGFQVYGEASGYAIAWHGMRTYVDRARPAFAPKDIDESTLYQGEPIEMNLTFRPAARLVGIIRDDEGRPVVDAHIRLSGLDYLNTEGREMHRNFREFWVLQAAPPRYRETRSNAEGVFAIGGLPTETVAYVIIEHPRFAAKALYAAMTDRKISTNYFIGNRRVSVIGGKRLIQPIGDWRDVQTGPLDVRLESPRRVVINVVHGDRGTPADGVRVYASSGSHDATGTHASKDTDKNGRVELALPRGTYRIVADPPLGVGYLRTYSELEIAGDSQEFVHNVRLKAGCLVILEAVDAENGAPIPGVRFWTDEGRPGERTSVSSNSSFYVDDPVTDEEGELRTVAPSGSRNYGLRTLLPNGFQRDPSLVKRVECEAGKTTRVQFKLRK